MTVAHPQPSNARRLARQLRLRRHNSSCAIALLARLGMSAGDAANRSACEYDLMSERNFLMQPQRHVSRLVGAELVTAALLTVEPIK